MSRAFVKEDDDLQRFRENALEEEQLREWLAIQEKKLLFLKESPKALEIHPEKRAEWICSVEEDVKRCRTLLGIPHEGQCETCEDILSTHGYDLPEGGAAVPIILFPLMFLLRIFRFIFPLLMLYLIFRILSGILSPGPGGGGASSGRRGGPSGSGSEDFRKEQGGEPDSRGPRNPYEILGCSPGDTNEEVRRHYRDLVTKYHPDRFIGMDLDDDFVKLASERFSEIQEAYKAIRRLRGLS